MSKLDIRGHEVLDPVPFQPTIPVKMEADDQIRNESDLAEDMLDFETEHTYGDDLIGPSPYEIGDDVPDGYVPKPTETPKQPETVSDLNKVDTASETPTQSQE